MPRLQSSMQSLAFNQIASPRQTQFSLLRQPPPHRSTVRLLHFQLLSRRSRASWRPSTKTQCFSIFAKTDLGGLQQNTNVLQLLSWRPSKPVNIHAALLAAVARKNTPFYPPSTPKRAISNQNTNVLPLLTWRPSKPRNSHACLLTAKLSKNTVFAPDHTTTWRRV